MIFASITLVLVPQFNSTVKIIDDMYCELNMNIFIIITIFTVIHSLLLIVIKVSSGGTTVAVMMMMMTMRMMISRDEQMELQKYLDETS